ncbi:MAG TPA: beta/gamma crystallin-related protein [Casimicrobiaceae bacterium]|nr:beta/gamma crystallin-related protein [Casimicrobiaceae bacterium]
MRTRFPRTLVALFGFALSAPALAGTIVLFEHQNLQGQNMVLRGEELPDLDKTTFNDRTESIVVEDGYWQVCTDSYYRGACMTLGPGQYPSLTGQFTRTISSVREVAPPPPAPPPPPPPPPPPGPRVILFEYPNFGGRQFVIDGQIAANLDNAGFNDRAASLMIEGGTWLFCTDANFYGTCRALGPGQYPQLPPEVANRISSARPISQ